MPEVSKILRPSFKKKTMNALKVDSVKHRLFLSQICLPVLNLIVSHHITKFLANVSRGVVSSHMVKIPGEKLQDTTSFDTKRFFKEPSSLKAQQEHVPQRDLGGGFVQNLVYLWRLDKICCCYGK